MPDHKSAPESAAEHDPQKDAHEERDAGFQATRVAGILVLLAALGPLVDLLWLALLPGAAILAFGAARIGRNPGSGAPRPVRYAALALSASAASLVLLGLTGLVIQRIDRVEPQWLTAAAKLAGWAFVAGVIAFAAAGVARRFLPGAAGVTLALSLPLGLAIETVSGRLPGSFLTGMSFSAALGLFGLSLIFISRGRRSIRGQKLGSKRNLVPAPPVELEEKTSPIAPGVM